MATQLLAIGTSAATAEFSLAAGATALLFLNDADPDPIVGSSAAAIIEIKDAADAWWQVDVLGYGVNAKILEGPGDFRVRRPAGTIAFGVQRG